MKFQIFRIEISPFGGKKKFRAIPFIVKRIKALIKFDSSSKISPFKFTKLPINYIFTFKEFSSLYGKECAVLHGRDKISGADPAVSSFLEKIFQIPSLHHGLDRGWICGCHDDLPCVFHVIGWKGGAPFEIV